MNALIELGLVVAGPKAHNHGDLRGDQLIELGSVVSETRAHDHGELCDGDFPTTSPAY